VGCFCTELGQKPVRRGPSRHVEEVSCARRTRHTEFFSETIPHRPILAKVRRTPDSSWMVQGLLVDYFRIFSARKEGQSRMESGLFLHRMGTEDGPQRPFPACGGGLVCEADPSHGVFSETIPHRRFSLI